jgi:curved DNA-binding protein CbpA
MRTYYLSVLGLGANATLPEIKSAYRKLARKYHPDVSTLPNAKEKFIAVKEAYAYLVANKKTVEKKASVKKTTPPKSRAETEKQKRRVIIKQNILRIKREEELEELEIQRYRNMSLKEFVRSEYFKDSARMLFWSFATPIYLAISAVFFYPALISFMDDKTPVMGIILSAIPVAFTLNVLFSRPK